MNWLWLLGDEESEDVMFVKVVKGFVQETFPYVKGNPHKNKPIRQLMNEFREQHGELTVEVA